MALSGSHTAVSRLTGLIYVACVYVRGQKLEESESESSRVREVS